MAYKKYSTPEEMQKIIDLYFKECDNYTEEYITKDGDIIDKKTPKPYTIEGLAVALDLDRNTLLDYQNLESHAAFHGTIKKAKTKILANLTERGLNGKNSTPFTIFNLVNNYDYKNASQKEEQKDSEVRVIIERRD